MAGIERTWATDGQGDGAFMIGPFDNNRTNEQGLLGAKATDYLPGTVLGQITATSIYVPINPAANDGSQNFAAINWAHRRAFTTGTKRAAVTVREATINSNLLVYDIAVTGPQKTAIELQMKKAGIIPGN